MTKHLECPECASVNLGDMWQKGRKLRQYCYDCEWNGNDRIPDKKQIISVKNISTNQFSGHEYTIYDKYGYTIISSRSYNTKEEAIQSLKSDLITGKTDIDAGPYTAVLWPKTIEVLGEVFT